MGRDEWISMDAPPKKTGSYIVATSNGAVCTAKWYGKTRHTIEPHFNGSVAKYITHWMELPKHPREEVKDDCD